MYQQQLLQLARLVDLPHAAIARHLHLSPVQVTRWYKGDRPVPKKYRQALWELVHDATLAFLRSGKADVWPDPTTSGRSLIGQLLEKSQGVPPLRRQIEALLFPLTLADLEQHGHGPSEAIESVFVALEAIHALPLRERRKPATVARLRELATYLQVYSAQLERLGPLLDVLEEDDHGTETREFDGP